MCRTNDRFDMRHHSLPLAGALLLAILGGCGDDPAGLSTDDVTLQLDKGEYVVTSGRTMSFAVIATLRNGGDVPIYQTRCVPTDPVPVYGIELVSPPNAEGSAFNPIYSCGGNDRPLVLPPRTSRTDTLLVRGPNEFNGAGVGFGQVEGTVALVYQVYDCAAACARADTILVRRRFTIRRG